jgi:hypothetical protein
MVDFRLFFAYSELVESILAPRSRMRSFRRYGRSGGPGGCCRSGFSRSQLAGSSPRGPRRSTRELRALVAARGPLRRALAVVSGQLVRARSWERLGFARLRDYAVERAGHSARSLQDLARVDADLARPPRVEAALMEGELTWTKARLLCRVACADDEALWVSFAREKTARALPRGARGGCGVSRIRLRNWRN